MPYADWLKMIS